MSKKLIIGLGVVGLGSVAIGVTTLRNKRKYKRLYELDLVLLIEECRRLIELKYAGCYMSQHSHEIYKIELEKIARECEEAMVENSEEMTEYYKETLVKFYIYIDRKYNEML